MKKMKSYYYLALSAFMLIACSHPAIVPTSFSETTDSLVIFPDYRDVTIPPNIAPLNFMVTDAAATEYVVTVGDLVYGAGKDGKIDMDSVAWRKALFDAKGDSLAVNVYAHRSAGWVHYSPFILYVAEEDIDPYLSYRLIEPGYELYRQLGIYQRDLTNFNEVPIYENNRSFSNEDNHCINCHNYQAYDTDRMLFHVRASHGGTIFIHGKEARKIGIKHDSILTSGVYPSWHPTMPLVAFSTNKTGQVFHMYHPEKIEVLDEASDLLLYDVEKNTVRHIFHTSDKMETFPCWAPDGRRLFYCCAKVPASLLREHTPMDLALRYDSLLYDIYSMPFDPETRTFGEPRLEVDASGIGHSTSVPRISPDGRYLLYTLGDYGQFHIWHKSSDLWVKDLAEFPQGEQNSPTGGIKQSHVWDSSVPLRPLTEANSPDAESYHTWSSNGRWILFVSRRLDHNYSRVFIAYFDREGQAHRAFLLPQRDPEYNILLLKSYNVPELTKHAVQVSEETLKHVIYHTDPEQATYE